MHIVHSWLISALRSRLSRLISEEKEYRRKAHTFIFDSCRALQAKALVIAAAMTICQRYFSQVSFRKIDRNVSRFSVS